MIIMAGLLISSCQELSIDSQPDAPTAIYIDALDEYDLLAISPSRIVFNVSTNTPWQIETDSQWCLPTPSMSAASSLVSEITVNTENNPDMAPRTATLKITAEELGLVKEITINQAARPEEPMVTDDPEVPAAGFDVTFAETASYLVNQSNGYVKVNFTLGEMLRTNFLVKKGRFTIEFDDMKMTSICNLGFVFLGSIFQDNLVWELADFFNYLMVLPNAIALFALGKLVTGKRSNDL